MKKRFTALLIAALMLTGTLSGCGNKDKTEETTDTSAVSVTDTTTAATTSPDTSSQVQADASAPLDEIITNIYSVKDSGLMVQTTPIDLTDADALKSYTGLTDASKLKEASASEPMIGSQAYSIVLVRVNDKADAASVAKDIMANINTAKWICVCANDTSAAVSGDLVMFVMLDNALELKASDFTDAFISLYGGETVTK